MNTIERLKERIEKTNTLLTAALKGDGSVDNNYIAVILLDIMQALLELLKKADRPVTLNLPTCEPYTFQQVVTDSPHTRRPWTGCCEYR